MTEQETAHSRRRHELRPEVVVALITVIGTIIVALIGLLGPPGSGGPTVVVIGPTSPPTATPAMPSAPTASPAPATTADPPLSATAAPNPATAGTYPCDATVSHWEAAQLSVVRDFPSQGALQRDPISVGVAVRVLDISGGAPPWYRIAGPDGRVLGWIPAEYLALSTGCPQP